MIPPYIGFKVVQNFVHPQRLPGAGKLKEIGSVSEGILFQGENIYRASNKPCLVKSNACTKRHTQGMLVVYVHVHACNIMYNVLYILTYGVIHFKVAQSLL